MSKERKVTIIIPLYIVSDRFFKDIKKFKRLDYTNYEILVVSDKKVEIPSIKGIDIKLILTKLKKTGPAEKRDIALKKAKGTICAFIDDDAYPHKDWLKKAVKHFDDQSIVAVGGPGITPKEDGYWEQISGLVYNSFFCSGGALHRFKPQPARFVEDYPAYNLIVRKSTLKKVKGYGTTYYGGEDTFLCLKLIKKGKIFYDPDVLVYHHRRKLIPGLLKQIANIGKHRGYFAKVYPETSRKTMYFLPSILTFGFYTLIILSFFSKTFFIVFLLLLFGAISIGALSVNEKVGLKEKILVGIGIILVHLSYGNYFIRGITISELKR